MKSRIITIGDEILIGQIVDTNSAWISGTLNDAGVRVESKLSIGDDEGEILRAVNEGLECCDVVIVTGGLGPTKDDITKKTLARYFGCGMVRHELSYEHVRQMLTRRGIDFNVLNQAQAMVPEKCTVLFNENGTAPGMWFEKDGKVLVSLPGVPFEMEALMRDEVMPRLREHFSLQSIIHKTAVVFGIAESALALKIEEWEDALPAYIKLAYLPNLSNIRLRLSAYEVDRTSAVVEIERQFAQLEKIIPENMVGYGDVTVASAVASMLTERRLTLSAAESCTGGAVSSAFTAMSGASAYFMGSVVSYSNDVKHRVLGVSSDDLDKYGAVSRQVAGQMAAGARKLCRTDYAISTTGVAGPDGGTKEKPVGTVWIAVAGPDGVTSQKLTLGSRRDHNITRAAIHAINLLRLVLLGRDVALDKEYY